MKELSDYKKDLNTCSKCGLCQSVCPIYEITKNDCSVSRGQFIMLQGLLKGQLKLSNKINYYLDLCLKCGACAKFCPSGIDIIDIFLAAKAEFFKISICEKIVSLIQNFIINYLLRFFSIFYKNKTSKNFNKKVIYFGGCGIKLNGTNSIIKILNNANIEVLTPNFNCCGIPFLSRGDFKSFNKYLEEFIKIIENNEVFEIVTTCASCEKTLKDYVKYSDNPILKNIKIKNIFEYIYENKLKFKLTKKQKITFHKPCNLNNINNVIWLLNNIENMQYQEMEEYDSCCGLNGITKFNKYNVLHKLYTKKRHNILKTNTKIVLTSCLGCEVALKYYSLGKYKVQDLIHFIAQNI